MSSATNSRAARSAASVLHPFTNLATLDDKPPLVIERGAGIYVYDDRGREYIEGIAGLWCTALGFGEEELVKAAERQMRQLSFYHGFLGRATVPTAELAQKLKAMAPFPASKVFFVDSGSEANDTQIKFVWHYNNAIGRPRKKKIISRRYAYHGATIGAASLTGIPLFHEQFDLPIPGILHTDCPNYYHDAESGETEEAFSARLAGKLEELILREGPDTIAAFIAEPIMAAAGALIPPAGYFAKLQDVLRRHDILMIADEVVTGFCRTGNMFGCETFGIRPDTMSLAKQLSSAYLPIGAVLIPEVMYEAFVEQSRKLGSLAHGMTYGGHPVPAALALRNLELIEERDILGHVRAVAPVLQARLRSFADHPLVGHVRGIGLLGAVELVADKASRRNFDSRHGVGKLCAAACEEEGLIVRASHNDAIAVCPPLVITAAEIEEMCARLARALDRTDALVTRQKLRAA